VIGPCITIGGVSAVYIGVMSSSNPYNFLTVTPF
jgi:hypothetical protein